MNYPKAHANRDYFIMQVPRISTQHITPEDGAKLLEARTSEVYALDNYPGQVSWHMVCLGEFDPSEWTRYSSAFALVMQFFADLGYRYLALDADGDVLPELPTFEW
jgi:hypothetical protein